MSCKRFKILAGTICIPKFLKRYIFIIVTTGKGSGTVAVIEFFYTVINLALKIWNFSTVKYFCERVKNCEKCMKYVIQLLNFDLIIRTIHFLMMRHS